MTARAGVRYHPRALERTEFGFLRAPKRNMDLSRKGFWDSPTVISRNCSAELWGIAELELGRAWRRPTITKRNWGGCVLISRACSNYGK